MIDERPLAIALHRAEENNNLPWELNCYSCAELQYSDNIQPTPKDGCWQIAHAIIVELELAALAEPKK